MSTDAENVVQTIISELTELPDEKVIEVLDFVRFLRVRHGTKVKRHTPRTLNEARLAELYAESADEELQLAEEGIEDYDAALKREDAHAEG
ncbi:MAG: DUF2281 domain-containing protein [Chloroflexota bacterium]|nr:MAG: DUF2281 domain-containing protein [Chloroflexota bacterium]